MRTVPVKKPVLILVATLLTFCIPLSANGGTISTAITTTHTVKDSGAIELEFKIRNRGNAIAHNVTITLILADLVKSYRDLGDNPPGGEIRLKAKIADPALNPGKYVAVMRVDFEEQNGKAHQAYHFFDIPYRMGRIPPSRLLLSINTSTNTAAPYFNKKAFWEKKDVIGLSMKNNGEKEIRPKVWLFLPEGFISPEPNRVCRLAPGETKFEEIPVNLEPDGKNLSPYHLVVWYDEDYAHYAWDLKGIIKVEDRPVYFKGYLIFGASLLVLLFAGLAIYNRRSVSSRQ